MRQRGPLLHHMANDWQMKSVCYNSLDNQMSVLERSQEARKFIKAHTKKKKKRKKENERKENMQGNDDALLAGV